jgi:hypothetical protein
MKYEKPIAIILNPNSGKKIMKKERIEEFLKERNIPC